MTETEFKHWAFVCFSPQDNRELHADAPGVARLCWGDWLLTGLKNFSTPADFAGHINARGEIVPDRIAAIAGGNLELSEGASLSDEVRADLAQSRYLVVVCSPRSAQSRAVDEIVRCFKQLGRGSRVLPVVIAGEPHARNASQPGLFLDDECFSPAMRHPVLPDGTIDTNRLERGYIFADARHGDDKREILAKDFPAAEAGLERAKIQLIAGLIGVGFNNLWQREQQRRFAGYAEAQGQIHAAWEQARKAQQEVAETQKLVAELQNRVRMAEGKAAEAETQLAAARDEVRDAQKKVLDAQHLPSDAKKQIEEAQARTLEAQQQVQQLRNQVREAENQLEQARNQAREAERKFAEAQQQARQAESQAAASQNQVQTIQSQSRDVQGQIQEAQRKASEAEEQARNAQGELAAFRRQTQDAEAQLQAGRDKVSAARRLTKVFAVLAVLAALAAGIVWSQRKPAGAVVATNQEVRPADTATNLLDSEQIRLALQQGDDLDSLAARIPKEKISETLNQAATILDDPQRSQFQGQLLDIWAGADAAAAFAWSCQLTNLESRQMALDKTIPAVAAENPTNALAELNRLQPAPGADSYALLFQTWAASDPAQAVEQRGQIPDHDANAAILSAILAVWGECQPEAALNWLQAQTNSEANIPAGTWRTFTTAGLFAQWADKDLEAASASVEQLSAGPAKNLATEIVLGRRITAAPATAVNLVTNLPPGDLRRNAVGGLAAAWAETDAPSAFAWAQSLADRAEHTNAVALIIGSWAQSDFPAATNAVFALPDDGQKQSALLALTEPWAQQNPRGLAAAALALPAAEVQTQWLTAACRQLGAADFATVAEELRPLSDAALRTNLLEQMAQNFELPELDTLAQAIAALPAGDDQQAALHGLIAKWQAVEPESALNWLRAFPETNAQPALVEQVLQTWAQGEPAAAARWLASLPPETVNEALSAAFLDGAVAKYPEFAAQWTQSVADENRRRKFQEQVARQWLKTDPAATTNWLNTLDLPEATKQTLKTPSP